MSHDDVPTDDTPESGDAPETSDASSITGAADEVTWDEREVCMCYHVPLRRLRKFYRLNNLKVASQFSECGNAGTGCGWCVPFLEKIFEQLEAGAVSRMKMSGEEYRRRRSSFRETGKRPGV